MNQTFFTVFTSTYNRKHTIDRVWKSLINQTNKNFEWIVIDNGSSDNIRPLLEEYKSKSDFDIRLIFQENQGKFMAFNKAVEMAKGELFFPADSDDSFEYDTIETFNDIWKKYKREDISGIDVLCKYDDGNIVGEKFPIEGVSSYVDTYYKQGIGGEKWGCIRVDILKANKFPDFFKVKTLPDTFVWAPIGFEYKRVFINKALRTYYQDAGDQLTHKKNESIEFFKMRNYFLLWKINYMFPKVEHYLSFKHFIQTYVSLWISTFKINKSIISVLRKIERKKSKIIAVMTIFPAFLINVFNLELKFLKKKKYKYQIKS